MFLIRLQKYHSELSEEDKLRIEELGLQRKVDELKKISQKREMMEKMSMKAEAHQLGKPKHPGNAFTLFIASQPKVSGQVGFYVP